MPGFTRATQREKVKKANADADADLDGYPDPQSLSEEQYQSYFGDLVDDDEYDSFIQHQEQLTKIQKLMPQDGNKPVETVVEEDIPLSL
jgi:hypothetical protein